MVFLNQECQYGMQGNLFQSSVSIPVRLDKICWVHAWAAAVHSDSPRCTLCALPEEGYHTTLSSILAQSAVSKLPIQC